MKKHSSLILWVLGAFLGYVLLYSMCEGEAVININRIINIESSNNSKAYNKYSQARGLMQITPICLREWNKCHWREQYSKADLFNGKVNVKIGDWYINSKLPKYLNFYKIPDTTTNRLIAFNWGVGNLRKYLKGEKELPKETRDYIVKYNKGGSHE